VPDTLKASCGRQVSAAAFVDSPLVDDAVDGVPNDYLRLRAHFGTCANAAKIYGALVAARQNVTPTIVSDQAPLTSLRLVSWNAA
jgi:hypothetical protein